MTPLNDPRLKTIKLVHHHWAQQLLDFWGRTDGMLVIKNCMCLKGAPPTHRHALTTRDTRPNHRCPSQHPRKARRHLPPAVSLHRHLESRWMYWRKQWLLICRQWYWTHSSSGVVCNTNSLQMSAVGACFEFCRLFACNHATRSRRIQSTLQSASEL